MRESRWHEPVCVAVLALLPLLVVGRALVPGRILSPAQLLYWYAPWESMRSGPVPADPLQSDTAFIFHSWLIHARREIRAGRFPLWNQNAYAGTPFLANMQSGVLCPFNALAYVLPLGFAIGLAAVAKLEVAGLGTYWFLRLLGAAPPAALLGGAAFMLSGFVVAWLGYSLSSAGVWLPVVFGAVEVLRRSASSRATAGVAAAVAVQWLGGHPETSAHVLGAAALWAAWRLRGALLGRALLGAVLGTLAAAVVLVPFVAWLPETASLAARRAAADMPAWPVSLVVSLLVPRYFGHPSSATLWNPVFGGNYNELSGTVGLVPWLILPCAFMGRSQVAPFFAAVGALCIPMIYRVPVLTPILAAIPGIAYMANLRVVLVLGFCASVLGGLGADRIMSAPGAERRRMIWPVTLVMLALTGFVVWRFRADHDPIAAGGALGYVRDEVVRAAALLLAGGLLIRNILLRPAVRILPLAALILVQLASSVPFARGFHSVMPAGEFFPRTSAIDFLARDAGGARVSLPLPNIADVFGLADPTGCDAMNALRISRLVNGGSDFGRYGNRPATLREPVPGPVLDLLGVRDILVKPRGPSPAPGLVVAYDGRDARVWRNPSALPLAFLVPRTRVAGDEEALRLLETGRADPRREALVTEGHPFSGGSGICRIEAHGPGSLVVTTAAAAPSFLVFLEAWDSGWTARVDGVRSRVVRSDYAFCGVAVPAGAHRVTFSYRPLSFTVGLILTLLAAAIMAALSAIPRVEGLPPSRSPSTGV
jgi:hypothetical protein